MTGAEGGRPKEVRALSSSPDTTSRQRDTVRDTVRFLAIRIWHRVVPCPVGRPPSDRSRTSRARFRRADELLTAAERR